MPRASESGFVPHWFTMALLFASALGIVVAIAIPSYLRWRADANERAALADMRALQRAMAAYRDANGGFYDSQLSCLTDRAESCIPNRPLPPAAVLAGPLAAAGPRHGYRFSLLAGPPPERRPSTSSPTSVTSFCYAATPEGPGGERYPRSFAVDDTDRTCFAWAAEPIPCIGGRLPGDCQTLE
jgi:type II secretory pathway pseudopilin PulG